MIVQERKEYNNSAIVCSLLLFPYQSERINPGNHRSTHRQMAFGEFCYTSKLWVPKVYNCINANLNLRTFTHTQFFHDQKKYSSYHQSQPFSAKVQRCQCISRLREIKRHINRLQSSGYLGTDGRLCQLLWQQTFHRSAADLFAISIWSFFTLVTKCLTGHNIFNWSLFLLIAIFFIRSNVFDRSQYYWLVTIFLTGHNIFHRLQYFHFKRFKRTQRHPPGSNFQLDIIIWFVV